MVKMQNCIIGIDAGLANMGYAILDVHSNKLIKSGLIQTAKSPPKKNVSECSDIIRRIEEIYKELSSVFEEYKPTYMCIEAFSYLRSASASAKYISSFSTAVNVALQNGVPILDISSQDVKMKIANKKSASKEDIIQSIEKIFKVEWVEKNTEKQTEKIKEHQADAIAVAYACKDRNELKLLRLLRSN